MTVSVMMDGGEGVTGKLSRVITLLVQSGVEFQRFS